MDKNVEKNNKDNVLTCVYCGEAYPPKTPTHGADVLTEHIKVCEKHPMRKAEIDILKLRKALIGVISVETKEELEAMEVTMRNLSESGRVPEKDAVSAINAIHVLLDTMHYENIKEQ